LCRATVSLAFQLTGSKLAPNVTDPWKVGADLNVVGSQYFIHDDFNQFSKVPTYGVVNLHSSYQVTKNVEVFGLIQNLFKYALLLDGHLLPNWRLHECWWRNQAVR
jgi:outer membrane receptor for ferrienterochelin and colicin